MRAAIEAMYTRVARPYDWLSNTLYLGQWRPWQRSAIGFLRGSRILELGMGTGNLQIDLAKAGFSACGIDFSRSMLRQARRKTEELHMARPRICQARAQSLPFPDASFDSIVSTFGTDYIEDRLTYQEVARVLRPGGRIVLVPGSGLLPGERARALRKLARSVATLGFRGKTNGKLSGEEELHIEPLQGELGPAGVWVEAIMRAMPADVFTISTYAAYNQRGLAVIIVGDKAGGPVGDESSTR